MPQNIGVAQAESQQDPESDVRQTGADTAVVLPKQIQQFTGEDVMTLAELIDRFHQYIHKYDLYVNENKESFASDATLEKTLGISGIHPVAELTRLISSHLSNQFPVDEKHGKHSEQLSTQQPKRSGEASLGQLPKRSESKEEAVAAQTKLRSRSKSRVPQTNDRPVVVKKTGLNTAVVLSKRMQNFAGMEMMTRAKLFSRFVQYIRENNLYIQGDKRRFKCDATLEILLGTTGIHNRSQIMRLMSPHLTSPSLMGVEYERRSRQLFEKDLKQRGAMDRRQLRFIKDPRGRNSPKKQALRERGVGLFADVEIAPALQLLCGRQQRMSRPQVLKAVWSYIKIHNLQDPSKRRHIIVNDMLRNGLQISADRKWIDCFDVTGYVSSQLTTRKAPSVSAAPDERRSR